MQTNKNYARALGVQWGFDGRVDPALGNTTNLAFPNNGSLGGRVGGTAGPGDRIDARPADRRQPRACRRASSAVGLGARLGQRRVQPRRRADRRSRRTGNGRLLSTPRVTTQNNVAAEMTQGVQIPIQTVSNNTVTVTLQATPR